MDLCREIRANPQNKNASIILLTAKSEIETKVMGFAAGADDYIPKPVDPLEIKARIAVQLRHQEQNNS